MFKDKLTVVAVALGLYTVLFGSIFFPFVRYTAYALLIAVVCQAVFKDKLTVVAVALGLLTVLFGSIFFPFVRYTAYALLIAVVCAVLLLGVVIISLSWLITRGIEGPKSLSGTRCQKCGKRRAMEEVSRTFLYGNLYVDFDYYMVLYRCSGCDQQEEQDEHVFPNKYIEPVGRQRNT